MLFATFWLCASVEPMVHPGKGRNLRPVHKLLVLRQTPGWG